MAGFRLKMATQLGEKVAEDAGFTSFPINPHIIARDAEISVQAKAADVKGVSGAIFFVGNEVTLIYSTEYGNLGFENFSIGHELGHYFLPGHPEEIAKSGGVHMSRANFTQDASIELEADHFASGLLLPSSLTKKILAGNQVGLEGILNLAETAQCSATAAAIRAAQCSPYPVAIIVSRGAEIAYAFISDNFKQLGKLHFLKKGTPLPDTTTSRFNKDSTKVLRAARDSGTTNLADWFDGPRGIELDEEVIGLGSYGYTLTVLSNEKLPENPEEEEDEDAELERSWTPRYAYGR